MTGLRIRFIEFACAEYPSEFFYAGYYDTGESRYVPHGVTLIESGGKRILVDSGIVFDKGLKKVIADGGGIKNRHDPWQMLSGVGLTPDDIDAIILTHLHFDHAGGITAYPGAKVYVQKKEIFGFLDILARPKAYGLAKDAYDPFDLHALVDLAAEGRLSLLDGEAVLFPGIRVRAEGIGHSFADQIVLVDVAQEGKTVPFCIAGDAANRAGNLVGEKGLEAYIPSRKFALGGLLDLMHNYDKLLSDVDGDVNQIIMTHDCSLFERFPTATVQDGLHVVTLLDRSA